MKLTKKHDPFARKCLTDLSMAREFLDKYLPAEIKAKCDFTKLSIVAGSYIEEDLKAHASDIVYKLNLKESNGCAYAYCLVEHQSSPKKLMPYRILRYQLAIIQKHIDEHPKDKLPLVVPVVFYNGTDKPYPYTTKLADLFADKEIFSQIGLGNFSLADLTVIEDDKILQDKKLAILEMLLKHIHDRDFSLAIEHIVKAFKIAESNAINPVLINSALFYLLSGREKLELTSLIEQLKQELPKYQETIMSYAEELRREGEQRGRQLEKQEVAKELLKSGIDPKVVVSATHLTLTQIEELKKSIN